MQESRRMGKEREKDGDGGRAQPGAGERSDEDQPGRCGKNRQADFFTFHVLHETLQTAQ